MNQNPKAPEHIYAVGVNGLETFQVIKTGKRKTQVRSTFDGRKITIDTKTINSPLSRYWTAEYMNEMIDAAVKKYNEIFGPRNKETFMLLSEAEFVSVDKPEREPDFVSGSGSAYYFTEDGVIRESDHWLPFVASCDWSIDGMYVNDGIIRCGYCAFKDFKPNDIRGYVLKDIEKKYLWAMEMKQLIESCVYHRA